MSQNKAEWSVHAPAGVRPVGGLPLNCLFWPVAIAILAFSAVAQSPEIAAKVGIHLAERASADSAVLATTVAVFACVAAWHQNRQLVALANKSIVAHTETSQAIQRLCDTLDRWQNPQPTQLTHEVAEILARHRRASNDNFNAGNADK